MPSNTFPNYLIRERTRLRLTQAELAKEIGVSKSAVSKWEIGALEPRPLTQVAIEAMLRDIKVNKR